MNRDAVLKRMLDRLPSYMDKGEGTFIRDLLTIIASEFENVCTQKGWFMVRVIERLITETSELLTAKEQEVNQKQMELQNVVNEYNILKVRFDVLNELAQYGDDLFKNEKSEEEFDRPWVYSL